MTKKKTVFLLCALLLFLLGVALTTISLLSLQKTQPVFRYELQKDFQCMEIDFDDCEIILLQAESSYVEFCGFRENEIVFALSQGGYTLSEKDHFWSPPIHLSGIGSYLSEGATLSEKRSVTIGLAKEDLSKIYNIALQDSSIQCDIPLEYVTLHAEASYVDFTRLSLKKMDAVLEKCTSSFAFLMKDTDFSRSVRSFDASLVINGQSGMNSEEFSAEEGAPKLSLLITNGSCEIAYPKSE